MRMMIIGVAIAILLLMFSFSYLTLDLRGKRVLINFGMPVVVEQANTTYAVLEGEIVKIRDNAVVINGN